MKPRPAAQILEALGQQLDLLDRPADLEARNAVVGEMMHLLAEMLQAPLREPEYHTVEDHRGTPFGPGAPIPYRKGSALYRALAIFRDHSRPITGSRFVECGGSPRDLERLIEAGHVVMFKV